MLDLPGIRKLEDSLLFNGFPRCVLSPETEQLALDLSIELFGITQSQTEFNVDDYWDCDDEEFEQKRLKHLRWFATTDLPDEDKVQALLHLGLDFRDDRGGPFRCTRLLSGQAEAAAKGVMGKLPDQASANLNRWANNLQKDAEDYLTKRKNKERI
jgi:phenylpropionate dioxygenase-like ring-hydroxylating dioxygenase large terminal subunit